MRLVPIIAAIFVAAVLVPVAASADRMWIGFHDDPMLRFDTERQSEMDIATATNNASVLRTLVTWADVAPTKPANAADPFDPAYKFDDLDEFVRNAQARDSEVLITLWGTPKWANGDKGPQLPSHLGGHDSRTLPRRLRRATRAAMPGIRSCGSSGSGTSRTWAQFLTPQFNSKGQIVSAAAYAKLAAAGYAGIKAGQPEGARRDRRDVLERQGQEGRRARAMRCGRERSPSSSPRRTRSSSSMPGRSTPTPCR